MLTCAHNCYYKEEEEEVTDLKFYPSPEGTVKKVVKVKKAYFTDEYKMWDMKDSKKYDFAILELAEDLSQQYGFLGIDSSPQNIVPQK